MNYTLCLDPYSVNFNINSLSGNGFNVYTDADNFAFPIAVNIPASSIFSAPLGDCSTTLTNVPNNATQILIVDNCNDVPLVEAIIPSIGEGIPYSTECCYALINIPLECNSLCDDCSITFDTFQTSSIGTLVAGELQSSCGTVTDYVIGWYLNGDYSAPAITTGFGTAAGSYQFGPHPLTGSGAVPVAEGSWEGIIHDIVINGTLYSNVVSGSKGGIPIPFESCFDTVVIDPLTCDNGTQPGKYSHIYSFDSQASGTLPAPVSLTYVLKPSTKYFAYGFQALSVWDELEIKWISGDPNATSDPNLYSQPIYLEKLKIGGGLTYNFPAELPGFNQFLPTYAGIVYNNTWPKQYTNWNSNGNITPFQRVLTLTNLETSSNPFSPDYLEITITPNPANNNTKWDLALQCLDDFDCSNCAFDDYPNSLPKIAKIELDKIYGCDAQKINLYISGCAYPSSDWAGIPIQYYFGSNPWTSSFFNIPNINLINSVHSSYFPLINSTYSSPVRLPPNNSYISLTSNVTCTSTNTGGIPSCLPPSSTTITLNKTPNQIKLTFNDYNDYLHYRNSLINIFTSLGITSPVPCNSNLAGLLPYYQYFKLSVPFQSPNVDCGDSSTPYSYNFHINDYFNIQYTNDNNPSATSWSITIPQTSIINCSTFSACSNCNSSIQTFINTYNQTLLNTFSFTTNRGAKYDNPFSRYYLVRNVLGGISGSYCTTNLATNNNYIPFYNTTTIPFISSPQSPTGWVNLPSLGASLPCNTTPYPYIVGWNRSGFYNYYQVRFPNLTSSFNYSLSTNDFELYSFTNFGPTGSNSSTNAVPLPCPDPSGSLIYSYIGGVATMHSSSYFWQGNNPILVIDP